MIFALGIIPAHAGLTKGARSFGRVLLLYQGKVFVLSFSLSISDSALSTLLLSSLICLLMELLDVVLLLIGDDTQGVDGHVHCADQDVLLIHDMPPSLLMVPSVEVINILRGDYDMRNAVSITRQFIGLVYQSDSAIAHQVEIVGDAFMLPCIWSEILCYPVRDTLISPIVYWEGKYF